MWTNHDISLFARSVPIHKRGQIFSYADTQTIAVKVHGREYSGSCRYLLIPMKQSSVLLDTSHYNGHKG